MAAAGALSRKVNDYSQLRTIPAMLSVAFVLASLYQFGGIASIQLTWIDYTVKPLHAVVVSLVAFVLAFMSSQTKSYERYETWEQALIASGPAAILLEQFLPMTTDLIGSFGEAGFIVAFLLTVASWGAAVR